MTADRPLLRWLFEPPTDRGIRFAGDGEDWDHWPYATLAAACHDLAHGLVDAGVRPGDTVAVVRRSGPGFVTAVFGAMLAGATPSPIAPPMAFHDPDVYATHVVGLLDEARPTLVVTEPDLVAAGVDLAGRSAARPVVTTVEDLTARAGPTGTRRRPAGLALVQFTSGSSGLARGVGVPYPALEANLEAIRRWLGYTPDDPGASWLPVHHDMGLIGCLFTPIWCRADLWLMRPEQFVQRPLRYLRCFGAQGARISAMPTFGLDHIARRVRPDDLAGLDFSRWKALIIGAERVRAASLRAFGTLLAPFGLRRECLLPAYGLAESTLVVTGLPAGAGWSALAVDARTLTPGSRVLTSDAPDALRLVGCGRPVDGTEVTVVGDDGRPLPDGHAGEIVVRGRSLARGYLRPGRSPSRTRLSAGVLSSGDVGFRRDGQLYVVGRLGDSVKVRGRALFAEDVEAVLLAAGLPGHRIAAALGLAGETPTVVVVAEGDGRLDAPGLLGALRRRAEGARVELISVPHGAIPRTSSGKPRRGELWAGYVSGDLQVRAATGS